MNNRYTIQRELGQGGMAIVYLAEDTRLNAQVALKVLRPEFASNGHIHKRFASEAKSMFRMSHPNIIKVNDLIDDEETVAIVMEYVEGDTLKDYIERKGKLSDDEIRKLLLQMLDALEYVHEQGLVHRDIKPSNFMITPSGKVKLMDFGIAKQTDPNASDYTSTGTTQQMGTPMYMSPEQVHETKNVTAQSDIYSLGVVLWQMVTGKRPYDTKTLSSFQLQSKIVNEPLDKTNSHWDELIQKATSKDMTSRFNSANSFRKAINKDNNKKVVEPDATIIDSNVKQPLKKEPIVIQENAHLRKEAGPQTPKKNYVPVIIIVAFCFILFMLFYNKNKDNYNAEEFAADSIAASLTVDSDGDGIADKDDKCSDVIGNETDGCFYYKKVTFSNESKYNSNLSIAYNHENEWICLGWYDISSKGSISLDLPRFFRGNEVYWYAKNTEGTYWWEGKDRYFKVAFGSSGFKVKDGKFEYKGDRGVYEYGFHKLNLTAENTNLNFGEL
jgi:serine/threonine protein kinase